MQPVESTSDQRTVNNTLRHQYRVLSDVEKENMACFKDLGFQFLKHVKAQPPSREMSIATTKIEEAVMWAVKAITA